jgi:hypothetical protein
MRHIEQGRSDLLERVGWQLGKPLVTSRYVELLCYSLNARERRALLLILIGEYCRLSSVSRENGAIE